MPNGNARTETTNIITITLGKKKLADQTIVPCVTISPQPARILRRHTETVTLKPAADNLGPVTINFSAAQAAALFNPRPPASVILQPNAVAPAVSQLVLHLRNDLGLEQRGTFEDLDTRFAREAIFDTIPAERCPSGDTVDIIIEQ